MLVVSKSPTHDAAEQGLVAAFLTSPIGGFLVLSGLLSAPLWTGLLGWVALELASTVAGLRG